MSIYKVFYFNRSGRNLIVSYDKGNYSEWGFDKPYRSGCCVCWAIHLGKLHIQSQTPNRPTEQ